MVPASAAPSSSSSSSSASSSSLPPQPGQPTKAAHACLQVLQDAAALLPMYIQGVRHLLGGGEALKGQDTAPAATHALRTLRDALDDVLGDGAKGNRANQDNTLNKKQDAVVSPPSTTDISTAHSTACAQVLNSKTGLLLTSIVGWLFHERDTLTSRVALSKAALVSKEWRHISRQACFWWPLVRALLPVVGTNEESLLRGRGHKGYFDCVCHYGYCLAEKQLLTGDSALFQGLEMHIDVWNAGFPSRRIYSAMGPIKAIVIDDDSPENPLTTLLHITGPLRKEVAGPAFSAADFDPMQRRYCTLKECVQAARSPSNPLHLCVRVTVTDRLTGKMALVFEVGKSMYWSLTGCFQVWVRDLVPGADHFMSTEWTELHRLHGKDRSLSSGDNGEEEISAYVGLSLRTLPGQEGVDEAEKKYTTAIEPSHHSSLASFKFNVLKPKTVASFPRSLLEEATVGDGGTNGEASEKQDAAARTASTVDAIAARPSSVCTVLQTEHLLVSIFDSLLQGPSTLPSRERLGACEQGMAGMLLAAAGAEVSPRGMREQ